jgi:hypothetical protein
MSAVDEAIADAYETHRTASAADLGELSIYRPLVDRYLGLWKNLMYAGWDRTERIVLTLHTKDWREQFAAGVDQLLGMNIRWVLDDGRRAVS